MNSDYAARTQEFAQTGDDLECQEIGNLIIETGKVLEALCLDEKVVDATMKQLHHALGLNESLIPDSERPWREVWESTSLSALDDLPLSQRMTSLSAYAYFGLSPKRSWHDVCTLADIGEIIASVDAAITAIRSENERPHDIARTVSAAKARFALDSNLPLEPEWLAALTRIGIKSLRNAIAPSSGSGLVIEDGRVTPASALTWLNARGDFKTSIWQHAHEDYVAEIVQPASGEILWVPFARDESIFHPETCRRAGNYTIGPKGSERQISDYRIALDQLSRARPAAHWRRPNSAGNWGIVTAAGFKPMTIDELGIATKSGEDQ